MVTPIQLTLVSGNFMTSDTSSTTMSLHLPPWILFLHHLLVQCICQQGAQTSPQQDHFLLPFLNGMICKMAKSKNKMLVGLREARNCCAILRSS